WYRPDWDTRNWERPTPFRAALVPEQFRDLLFHRELPRPPGGLVSQPGDFPFCAVDAHLPVRFAGRASGLFATAYAPRATHASRRRSAIRLVPRNTSTPGLR